MSTGGSLTPADSSWVAAVHESASDFESLGVGVVIDDRRVLTAAHVAVRVGAGPGNLWVAFPMAPEGIRRRVARIVLPEAHVKVKDLAILVLEHPVPASVNPAPLRAPKPADLTDRRWWAFGFPEGDELGNDAAGTIGAPLAYGWIRLDTDTDSRYKIQRGFSGAGLWSPDYQSVIAIIGQGHTHGDGRAITMHEAIRYFPDQNLSQLSERLVPTHFGEPALTSWGWSLGADPEGIRHWRPRARGVSLNSERGHRFRGRTAALRAINSWLDRPALDARVLVVTGAPGAGKSAVLGRVVTTSDPTVAAELPAWDNAVRAIPNSVACAVHARGKTSLEIATDIARAASAALPGRIEDFPSALRDALADRAAGEPGERTARRGRGEGGRSGEQRVQRFNVLIDALDEATDARAVIAKVILPIAETCADVGAQLVVGSRRRDDHGDLLDAFGPALKIIDLDDERFFVKEDLTAYAHAVLQIERPGNPYASDDVAVPVAVKIAELSAGNFLVAGLTARLHGLYDETPVSPADLSFTPTVDAAMYDYLHRLPPVPGVSPEPHHAIASDVPAETLLTALAFAEDPGLPADLWQMAVRALAAVDVPPAALARFARSSAANFLIESFSEGGTSVVFRLFHQALNDSLLRARAHAVALADDKRTFPPDGRAARGPANQTAILAVDERALTQAFLAFGRGNGWDHVPPYLRQSLPAHAVRAGMLDDLLADDTYLLYADLLRLLPLVTHAESQKAQQRARLLRLAPGAIIAADPPTRAALLSVTETMEGLGDSYTRSSLTTPYRAAWAASTRSTQRQVLEGHHGQVRTVCAFTLDGRACLATGDDKTVRVWDAVTGAQRTALEIGTWVVGVCAFTLDGRVHLASVGGDGKVWIWDAVTGAQRAVLEIGARAVCAFVLNGRACLATGGKDGTVRVWDAATGAQRAVLKGHAGEVAAVCAFVLNGRACLATGGAYNDRTVRIWDAATGAQRASMHSLAESECVLCAFTVDGRVEVAVGTGRKSFWIWDTATGARRAVLESDTRYVNALCAFTVDDHVQLAAGGHDHDGNIQIWDAATGARRAVLEGRPGLVYDICAFTLDGRVQLAAAGAGLVQIWDAATGAQRPAHEVREDDTGPVEALCAFALDGRVQLAAGGAGTVRVRDAATGARTGQAILGGHTGWVKAICAFTLDDHVQLAALHAGKVLMRDAATGVQRTLQRSHTDYVDEMCAFTLEGRAQLATATATADEAGEIQVWDAATGVQRAALKCLSNGDAVTAMCAFSLEGRDHLAFAEGNYGRVRVWDVATGANWWGFRSEPRLINAISAYTLDGRVCLAAGTDISGTVQLWDAATGDRLATLRGHNGAVKAICACTFDDHVCLATAGADRTVRIWDPVTAKTVLVVPTRDTVSALSHTGDLLAIGTPAGLLTIHLNPGARGSEHKR
jgi:WD40 repeat protein